MRCVSTRIGPRKTSPLVAHASAKSNANNHGWPEVFNSCVNVTDPDSIMLPDLSDYPDRPCTRMAIAYTLFHSPHRFPKFEFYADARARLGTALSTKNDALNQYVNVLFQNSGDAVDAAGDKYDAATMTVYRAVGDLLDTLKETR